MQEDDELLQPLGPDDKNTEREEGSAFSLSEDELSEKAKVCSSEAENKQDTMGDSGCCCSSSADLEQMKGDSSEESAPAHSFEMPEFSQPLEEIKGQMVENRCTAKFSEENRTENDTEQEDQTSQGGTPAGSEEEEDDCPCLVSGSPLNREPRPFRYRLLWIVS